MLKKHPLIQITIAVASLASIGIFIHKSDVGPIITGFYRCLFAMPLLIMVNSFNKSSTNIPLSISKLKLLIITLIGGISLGMDMCVWNLSFNYTTMAEANLIVNITPLLIFPVTIFYFKERISALVIIPFGIALCGLYALVFSGTVGVTNFHIKGDMMALIAAVFYAIFVVVTKIAADNGVNMGRYMVWISFYCALLLLIAGIISHEQWLPHSLWGWTDLILLAFISQIFGQLFLAHGMKRVSLQISSVFLLLQPIFAALYGFVLFGEKLSPAQSIGAIAVLFSVYLVKRIEQISKQAPHSKASS